MNSFDVTQRGDTLDITVGNDRCLVVGLYLTRTSDGWYLSFNDGWGVHNRFLVQDDIYKSVHPYAMYCVLARIYQHYKLSPRLQNEVFKAIRFIELRCVTPKIPIEDIDGKETDLDDDKVYKLIEAADMCRKEIVLCLMGKPGIGKTEAVERFAKDHGRNVVHIIASQILPSEVSGMTMPNQETRSMDVFDHYRLSHMKDGDILFFDELLKGQQAVLNACLTLIQERRLMSGTELPDVLIIAAANPLATPVQLPVEIRQRFLFVDVEWDEYGWIEYMKNLGFKHEEELAGLASKISASLDRTDSWNTLTPRTATKLCQWLRASDDSPYVRDYILNAFDGDVLSRISNAVNGAKVEKPEVQVAHKVMDFLHEHGHEFDPEDDENSGTNRINAMSQAVDVVNGESSDLSGLIDTLMKLPEWEKIQEVLQGTEIEREDIEF